jgi:hypothetical protein
VLTLNSVESGRPEGASDLRGTEGGVTFFSGAGVSSFLTLLVGLLATDCRLRISTGDAVKIAEKVG